MFIKLGSECCFTEFSATFHLPHPSFWQTGSQRFNDNSFFSTIFLQQTLNWIPRLAEAPESAFVAAAVWRGLCMVAGGNHGSNRPQCGCVDVSSFMMKDTFSAGTFHHEPLSLDVVTKAQMGTPPKPFYFMLQLNMKIYFCFCLDFYL